MSLMRINVCLFHCWMKQIFDLQVRVRKELNIEKAFNQVKSRKRTHDRRFKRVWQLSLVASIAVLVVVCSVMLYKGQEAGVKQRLIKGLFRAVRIRHF